MDRRYRPGRVKDEVSFLMLFAACSEQRLERILWCVLPTAKTGGKMTASFLSFGLIAPEEVFWGCLAVFSRQPHAEQEDFMEGW